MTDRGSDPRSFSYHDSLRAVGAWLDVRGHRDVRIVECDGELVIEASPGKQVGATTADVLTFDRAGVFRFRQAALRERGARHAPLSPIPAPSITPLVVRSRND